MTIMKTAINSAGFFAGVVCLVLLASCASTPKEIIKYKSLTDKKLEPVSRPAEITKLSESELKNQGYSAIGDISVEQVLKECYERCYAAYTCSRTFDSCSDNTFTESPSVVLVRQAAEKGGHVVLLREDNQAGTRSAKKQSAVCNRQRTETRSEYKTVYTQQGSYSQPVERTYTTCEEYQFANGEQTFRRSAGSVWRKLGEKAVTP